MISYNLYSDVFTGLTYAYSTDPKYPHLYGQGRNVDEAVRCLKIRINQIKQLWC